MLAEIGLFVLIVAFVLSLCQSVVPMIGAHYNDQSFMRFGVVSSVGQFVAISISFACLMYSFIVSDFSLTVVAQNSNTAMPTIYKVSGVWGNHEGSMLLWVLILALFAAAVAVFGENLPSALKARVIAVQGMISAGFLSFILFTSNPFARLTPVPADGNDLNPLLQDLGLAIHPPFLYLGYVGFSIAFSFSVAALIEGRVDASWARWVRPWVLAAWCFLTVGITLGSYWAYYELGWGGYWFWDPVENASFMPWIVGTALLHSALVVERRQTLVNWTILLGILAFSLSLVGTFLVRSGILTSVHAFAQDPDRGAFILVLLALTSGGALALYAIRIPQLKRLAPFSPVSREGGLTLNNILLVTAAGTVFIGTFYPLLIDLFGKDKISVGAPYYNLTFVPIMIPLLIAMSVGTLLKWKREDIWNALSKLKMAAIVTGLSILFVIGVTMGRHIWAALGIGLAVWVIAGALAALAHRIRLGQVPLARSMQLARTTPRSVYAMVLAHAGVGITAAGITVMTAWQAERIEALDINGKLNVAGYEVTLKSVDPYNGPNFEAVRAIFDVTLEGEPVTTLTSERRLYTVRNFQTTEAGISSNMITNLYVALGGRNEAGLWTVRAYYHPLAPWIWFGPLIMSLGGFLSLTDRRLRVGAPQKAKPRTPVLSPAE